MRIKGIVGALAATLIVAGAAEAATLADASGTVLVNTGSGFRPAPVSAPLPTGSQVMVRQGEAKVSYADFCVVVVKPGSVYTVAEKSPCGAAGPTPSVGAPLPADIALIAGGVAVGAGVLIYQATKSKPASP